MKCTICNFDADWVENKAVYGRNYGESYMIWLCTNKECRAYVGCHQNTQKSKGTFADRETRRARMKAHFAIDPLWKSGRFHRNDVYKILEKEFGREIHIGGATVEECNQIIKIAAKI